jgi:hypothetical protein
MDEEQHLVGCCTGCTPASDSNSCAPLTPALLYLQEALFAELHKLYGKLEKQKNPDKITSLMNQIVMKLKDCKR